MSTNNSLLDDPQYARIFTDEIVPDSNFHQTTSQDTPRAIITAGQPGAGKGGLVRAARKEFRNNVGIIDPDELRGYVPGIEKMREQHPLTWSGESHPVAKGFANGLSDLFIDNSRNLISDITLAGADPVIDQIKIMQGKGYQVEIRAIATHWLESELGIDSRFTRDLTLRGYGRHVPGDFHDFAYEALPGNLDKIHKEFPDLRIRIFDRNGVMHYDNHDSRTSTLKPSEALEKAREARMHDPKVTRSTAQLGRTQQEFHQNLPETLKSTPVISAETAKNLPPEVQALEVVPRIDRAATEATAIDRTVRIEPGAARVALGLKVASTAAVAYDAFHTEQDATRLLDQDNLTGAQSSIVHFGSRNLGMFAGAALGVQAGAALGIETGPGALATGTIGGVLGAVGGDYIGDALDNANIYNQKDAQGLHWNHDPQRPERGWTRIVQTNDIDPKTIHGGQASPLIFKTQTLHADAQLADRLNYQASNTRVELAMAHAPMPKNPYQQPSAPSEHTFGRLMGDWERNPQTHVWSRTVTDTTQDRHWKSSTETATAQQAAQLDKAAQATIAQNLAQTPKAMAEHYRQAYEQSGWQRHGAMPAAVNTALHTPANQIRASDGNTYTQSKDGQWTTPGTLYGVNTAKGALRDELDLTHKTATQRTGTAPVHSDSSRQDKTAPSKDATPAHPNKPITKESSTSDMFKALMISSMAGDIQGVFKVGQAYLQSPQGQALMAQGNELAQQQQHQHTQQQHQPVQQPQHAPQLSHPVMRR